MLAFHRSLVLVAVTATALLLAIGPVAEETSAKPAKAPRLFQLSYQWGGDSLDDISLTLSPKVNLTLRSNGRFDVTNPKTGVTTADVGDWSIKGSKITIDLDNGTLYTGKLQTDGSYFGTATSYLGFTGVWTGRFVSAF